MKSKTSLKKIFKEILDRVEPPKGDIEKIEKAIKDFYSLAKENVKKRGMNAEIFVGGSYAKKTLIKKDHYDIDVFIRFDQKEEEISEITEKIIEGMAYEKVHGSRDYFRIKVDDEIFLEIVPVKKVTKPENAENITDLSYFHVKYVNKKIKDKKILDEIKIAKAFCHANNTYGAESYIQGFSGYALELLVCHYKSFIKFLKNIVRVKKEKLIVDIEKHYKKKKDVMLDINSSKLVSPIILVDPTYKQRNVSAALSEETFRKFVEKANKFLKNPSVKEFEKEKTDLEKIEKDAKRNKFDFVLLEADTGRQEGDIAGSKLLKFYRHFAEEMSEFFEIKDMGFNYNKKKTARYYFVAKGKGKIILDGPELKDGENLLRFRKKHKNVFTQKGKIYAREEVDFSLKEFIDRWKKKNIDKMKEMDVSGLRIV